MSASYSAAVSTARDYYNSDDADNFYYHVWGGEDIHIGLYESPQESIATASRRTVDRMAERVLDKLSSARAQVIDLGSGYGGAARVLAGRFDCRVLALNLSEAENERHRQLNREAGVAERIEVVEGSFEAIPGDGTRFDVAWSQDAILHSGHRDRVLAEVDRVLKPGGEFVFTDPMQADDCPNGVLAPVLERIHLSSLGSFGFYREQARKLGWQEVGTVEMTGQLVRHYTRVAEELEAQRSRLAGLVSDAYVERMLKGLANWVEAGNKGYLAWGILHFRKPA
ncbi:class I SAM-dependent methyltransferase [Candidatus Thiosymbion oneisti]|uniref:class I SAM-dependent methyltransferase n=1 Tax=Candidatus Thiosymbion oneisti TaxID=589554 RepID=UPI000B28377F|nr:class I SAM-dependent methyltransferase [Candidatus Thiosymbion oneisti]